MFPSYCKALFLLLFWDASASCGASGAKKLNDHCRFTKCGVQGFGASAAKVPVRIQNSKSLFEVRFGKESCCSKGFAEKAFNPVTPLHHASQCCNQVKIGFGDLSDFEKSGVQTLQLPSSSQNDEDGNIQALLLQKLRTSRAASLEFWKGNIYHILFKTCLRISLSCVFPVIAYGVMTVLPFFSAFFFY